MMSGSEQLARNTLTRWIHIQKLDKEIGDLFLLALPNDDDDDDDE